MRNYILWLLNDTNPYRDDYLQLTGIYKMSELSGYWLEGIYSDAIQHELANYLGALNAYFFFEVISDNLAIGLASPNNNDNQQQNERRTALKKFNDVMQQKLKGDTRPILELLSSISHLVNSISCFDQSLAATEARKLASEYTKQTDISINELEHATLSYLALNIASCLEAYELVADHPIATSILNSLISRYSAVNTLLDMEKTITITTLTQCGTKTILVVPTLLYIISAIDKIKPNPNLPNVINNGSLLMAVRKASCLIRLQNDIGTPLLISDSNSRNLLKQKC
ncbi:MAG: hypothetical protein HWD59_14670 [Coxiellaceae bacterium]|nr:MAG: hypothetical protein HWD59_14670 [Coxiellaceae bacterium]